MLQALSRAGQADVILLTVWFALNLVLLCLHEPWRDEAEAFMIAREYGLGEIWRQLSSEGQPLLWFLILLVPAKLGVPFRLAGLISLFVCAAAAARFLRVSPLPKPLTWIILFSPLFTYYNPVISRSYCIALLLCVHLIGIRRSRRPRPVALGVAAALLFQTHLMLSGVALGCTLELLAGCIAGRAKRRLPPDSPGDLPGLMRRPADRQYLAGFLDGQRFKDARCSIGYRRTSHLEIAEDASIPDEFLKRTVTVDKAGLTKAIKDGGVIEGVSLVEGHNIQIR